MAEEPVEACEILLIIDRSEQYSYYAKYIFVLLVGRVSKHKCWDYQILYQDPNREIPTGAIYKTTWEQDETLRKYVQINISSSKVCSSHSAAAMTNLFLLKKD